MYGLIEATVVLTLQYPCVLGNQCVYCYLHGGKTITWEDHLHFLVDD